MIDCNTHTSPLPPLKTPICLRLRLRRERRRERLRKQSRDKQLPSSALPTPKLGEKRKRAAQQAPNPLICTFPFAAPLAPIPAAPPPKILLFTSNLQLLLNLAVLILQSPYHQGRSFCRFILHESMVRGLYYVA